MVFRDAVIDTSTQVQVGYMTSPQSVATMLHSAGLFIHVASNLDWVCRAVTGKGRSTAPLKGHTQFLDQLLRVPFDGKQVPSALAGEVDPMDDLLREDDCAGGQQEQQGDLLETPKKRSKKLTKAELQFVASVPLQQVVDDLDVFQGKERERVSKGVIRVLLKTNRRRSVYVHEKDLDMCMLVMLRHVERMGVPHVDLPDDHSALAEAPEWFDARTSCWHVRVGKTEEVLVSKPVRRVGVNSRPLEAGVFKRLKMDALVDLKAQCQGIHTPGLDKASDCDGKVCVGGYFKHWIGPVRSVAVAKEKHGHDDISRE